MSWPLQIRVKNLLSKCTFKQLKQIQAFILTTSLQQNPLIRLYLLRRSTEFGEMEYPELIFSQMGGFCNQEITIWNAMIRGYAYNGPQQNCMLMYDEMPQRGLRPNNFTYPYVLNSCSDLGLFRIGIKVHCRIIKFGFEPALSVAGAIFHFYVKFVDSFDVGCTEKELVNDARRIFDGMCFGPVELWNRMISEYVKMGDIKNARELFEKSEVVRDTITWNLMVSGYAKTGDIENARYVFEGMPEKNVVSWTTMIKACGDAGDLNAARELFEMMPEKNVVSWNCMISAYTQNRNFQDALNLFSQMRRGSVIPDGYTYVSALSACSHLGALELGKWVHGSIRDWDKLEVIAWTALVEMYAKCGDIDTAFNIFIKTGNKDVFCYNVMIKSLAIHGRTGDAIRIFYLMQGMKLKPNEFTFSSVLFACSHGGSVEEGRKIFNSMEKEFKVYPKLEHYGCLMDLLCRSGQLEEALLVLKEMPFKPDIAIWGALLGGCKMRGDLNLAETVITKAEELESDESGVYVILSSIHAAAGQWLEALDARVKMEQKSIWKRTGSSNLFLVQ